MNNDIIATVEELNEVVKSVIDLIDEDSEGIKKSLHYAVSLIEAVRKYLDLENCSKQAPAEVKYEEEEGFIKHEKKDDYDYKESKYSTVKC